MVTLTELHIETRTNFDMGKWAVSATTGESRIVLKGNDTMTSDDRLVLQAAAAGLSTLRRRCAVELFTSSAYLVTGARSFIPVWLKDKGKAPAFRASIRNLVLWDRLISVASRHDIQWHLIKSRSEMRGRTPGQGGSAVYAGKAEPWDDALGEYREFSAGELLDPLVCDCIADENAPIDFSDIDPSSKNDKAALAA